MKFHQLLKNTLIVIQLFLIRASSARLLSGDVADVKTKENKEKTLLPTKEEPPTEEPIVDEVIRIKNPPKMELDFDKYMNWKGSFDEIWAVANRYNAFTSRDGSPLDLSPYYGIMEIKYDSSMARDLVGCLVINNDNVNFDCNGHEILPDPDKKCSCGITINSKHNVQIHNCRVMSFEVGVCVTDSTSVGVYQTVADGNDQGFNVHDSSSVLVQNSIAMNSSEEGFEIRRSDDSVFYSNLVMNNGRDGFDENDGSNSYYYLNFSLNNAMNGFELDNHINANYSNNVAVYNGKNGISLDEVDGALMSSNTIFSNGKDGLRLDDNTSNFEVVNNYSFANAEDAAMQCGNGCDNNVFTNNLFIGPTTNI